MDPITAQILVSRIHRTGIENAVQEAAGFNKDRQQALWEIIQAAKETDCPALAATACTMYETVQS
jgi:hypothetical protein